MPVPCKAVTFDFWNTVAVDTPGSFPRRVEASVALFEAAGLPVTGAAVDAAIRSALRAYRSAWAANRQFGVEDGVTHCLAQLGVTVTETFRRRFAAELGSGDLDAVLAPNIATSLRTLKAAGVRIGLISDIGFTPSSGVRRVLDRHGLLELFDHLTFSDEVGHFKPIPAVFAHAFAGLGVRDPADAVHVGDLRRTDVAGALAAGCVAVRYAAVFDDVSDLPDGHHVIGDHAELPAIAGVA